VVLFSLFSSERSITSSAHKCFHKSLDVKSSVHVEEWISTSFVFTHGSPQPAGLDASQWVHQSSNSIAASNMSHGINYRDHVLTSKHIDTWWGQGSHVSPTCQNLRLFHRTIKLQVDCVKVLRSTRHKSHLIDFLPFPLPALALQVTDAFWNRR